MSPIEHYFENLLTMGSDIKGEPNKNALSKEVQEAIEICADYIKNIQLYNNAISDDSNAEKVAMLTELKTEIEEIKMGNNVPFGFEPVNKFYEGVSVSSKVVQQKIDKLKENNDV